MRSADCLIVRSRLLPPSALVRGGVMRVLPGPAGVFPVALAFGSQNLMVNSGLRARFSPPKPDSGLGWSRLTLLDYPRPAWSEHHVAADLGRCRLAEYVYLMSVPKPVVAAINGPVAGMGVPIVLACDLRFMAEERC